MEYIDYGEINTADEELLYSRHPDMDGKEGCLAVRVVTGDENKCEVLEPTSKINVQITVKEGEEYSAEIELPVLAGPDRSSLRLNFHVKDHNGGWKSVVYWISEEEQTM